MTAGDKLRTIGDVLAIIVFWGAILFLALVAGIGECFEPGCGEAIDDYLITAPAVVAAGFLTHVGGYIWLKARGARRR